MLERILFLAPHPDDELVAAAVSMARTRAAGGAIHILFLTTGVPAPDQLWPWRRADHATRVTTRRSEALRVADALNSVPIGFSEWPSRSLKSHIEQALAWISQCIREYAIEAIWVPAWEGGHQDHDVANFLASHAANGRPVIEFAEYNWAHGSSHWHRFAVPNGTETVLRLTGDEIGAKKRLLAMYRSEKANLGGVRFDQEMFRPLPAHDYGARPHSGPLWRERFHWVGRLIRHPGVDFEPTDRVIETLAKFAATPSPAVSDPKKHQIDGA